jgi:hypothetical protein
MGFVVDKVDMGQVYRRVLRFSPASSYSINATSPRLSPWAATIGPFANVIPRDKVSPYNKTFFLTGSKALVGPSLFSVS